MAPCHLFSSAPAYHHFPKQYGIHLYINSIFYETKAWADEGRRQDSNITGLIGHGGWRSSAGRTGIVARCSLL